MEKGEKKRPKNRPRVRTVLALLTAGVLGIDLTTQDSAGEKTFAALTSRAYAQNKFPKWLTRETKRVTQGQRISIFLCRIKILLQYLADCLLKFG